MELTQVARKTGHTTPAERRQIVSLYGAGTEIADIRAVTGRSVPAIYSALMREGVELRRRQSNSALRTFCEVCGEPVRYVPPARRKAEGAGRFCSQACMGEAKRLPPSSRAATELQCSRCGETKPVSEFHPHAHIARGYQYWCKECLAESRRLERAEGNRDLRMRRKHVLKATYGITVEDYEAMYERQGGCCAICGEFKIPWEPGHGAEGRTKFLVVDHCHETSRVRGLLCFRCNCGLGQFREDPDILLAAIDYLASQEALAAA